jgi:hypothetical protein
MKMSHGIYKYSPYTIEFLIIDINGFSMYSEWRMTGFLKGQYSSVRTSSEEKPGTSPEKMC